MKRAKCAHRLIRVRTERDRCSWVVCEVCGKGGPAKHSYTLALLAWALHLVNQHPRPGKPIRRRRRAVAAAIPEATEG